MIQLICPPYNASVDSLDPPLNLLVLGAALLDAGYEVCLTDLALLYSGTNHFDSAALLEIAQLILNKPSKYLGLTAMCGNYSIALRIAEECKRLDPDRIIILGGPHASFVAEETLTHFPSVDYIVIGEGELTLPELIAALESDHPLKDVEGLCFRLEGAVHTNPPRRILKDLDETPFPAFHLIDDIDAYFTSSEPKYFPIEAGRGCPFNCSFCSTSTFFSRKYRTKSPARIIAEMQYVRDRWDIAHFSLTHDNFTVNQQFVRHFCQELIKCNESFTWSCSSRTDHVNKALFEYMMQAGCNGVFFGIESGSQPIQKVIGKKLDLNQAFSLLRELHQLGLSCTVSFIMGFPEETQEDINQTLDLIVRLFSIGIADVQLHHLSPFPGTQLYDAEKDGLVLDDQFWSTNDMNSDFKLSGIEKEWIATYPQIFSNYYSLRSVDTVILHRIRKLYYPLAHSFFRTMYYLNHQAAASYTHTIDFVSTRLASNAAPPQEAEVASILDELIQGLAGDVGLLIKDFFSYEQAVMELMQQAARPLNKDKIKPVKVIQLHHSILELNLHRPLPADIQLLEGNEECILLVLESASAPEGHNRYVRVMSMDDLSIAIIRRIDMGGDFQTVVHNLSLENPFVSSEEERQDWIGQVYDHFYTHQLLTS
ncbi:B12-binding domain-containing radical SAM protein [Paenibacillus sp. HW567]|uniref:B12-binding domain-containing radical SAM protein n=1 Tax=Paenibacillus sp. HW567 TaxID=1034769 RepID=UPI000373129B|nr:radical SAM protein [Paenibacillus sp. HW567]